MIDSLINGINLNAIDQNYSRIEKTTYYLGKVIGVGKVCGGAVIDVALQALECLTYTFEIPGMQLEKTIRNCENGKLVLLNLYINNKTPGKLLRHARVRTTCDEPTKFAKYLGLIGEAETILSFSLMYMDFIERKTLFNFND